MLSWSRIPSLTFQWQQETIIVILDADDDILGMFGRKPAALASTSQDAQQKPCQAREIVSDAQAAAKPEFKANWMQPQKECNLQPVVSLAKDSELLEEEDLSLRLSFGSQRNDPNLLQFGQLGACRGETSYLKPDDKDRLAESDTSCRGMPEGVLAERNRRETALTSSARLDPYGDGWRNGTDVCPASGKQECSKNKRVCGSNWQQPGSRQGFKVPAFEDGAKARAAQQAGQATSARAGEQYFLSSADQMPKHRLCGIKNSYASAEEYKRDCLLAIEEEVGLRHGPLLC